MDYDYRLPDEKGRPANLTAHKFISPNPDGELDDDDVFIKLSGLPVGGTLWGYEHKSHIAVDSTLLLSALGVSSIYYTFWLSQTVNF